MLCYNCFLRYFKPNLQADLLLFQITPAVEMQYDDAFTIKAVDKEDVDNFNYMAGMVPLIQFLIDTVSF